MDGHRIGLKQVRRIAELVDVGAAARRLSMLATAEIRLDDRVTDFVKKGRKLLIGGQWVDAASGRTFPVYNPATGEVIAHVAEGGKQDIDRAVTAARRAYESGPWPRLTPSERGRLVWKLGDLILEHLEECIVVKGVESPERRLDETSLLLHRVITELPIEKQRMLEKLNSSDEDLIGKTVLLVDDDARNIFALSSVLERRGMKVLTATTGNEAIGLVESSPTIAIVLMDIMMPQMDGYQTIGVIRQNPSFARLPIIALTAKAMKGDREKCLEAGASDYLAKPVNTEQLLLAIRMWLHR
jgi:CheY-like chemotaxis protein